MNNSTSTCKFFTLYSMRQFLCIKSVYRVSHIRTKFILLHFVPCLVIDLVQKLKGSVLIEEWREKMHAWANKYLFYSFLFVDLDKKKIICYFKSLRIFLFLFFSNFIIIIYNKCWVALYIYSLLINDKLIK